MRRQRINRQVLLSFSSSSRNCLDIDSKLAASISVLTCMYYSHACFQNGYDKIIINFIQKELMVHLTLNLECDGAVRNVQKWVLE